MWETYGDDVQFLVVYIKEAHAIDSRSPLGGDGMPMVEDPVTMNERLEVAKTCMTKLALEPMPAIVDNMDNVANNRYEAWPDRLYLIGRNGEVAYKGGPGPFGFTAEDLEAAIQTELEKH